MSDSTELLEALKRIKQRAKGPYLDRDTREDFLRDLRHIDAIATSAIAKATQAGES